MASAEIDIEKLDGAFNALAHPARRQILLVLKAHGGRMTAGEIARRFSCAWPTTSRHLSVLARAGLVAIDRRGRARIYRLNQRVIRRTVGAWVKSF